MSDFESELDDDDEPEVDEVPALDRLTLRVIAAALCDGSWEPRDMRRRLVATVEVRSARDERNRRDSDLVDREHIEGERTDGERTDGEHTDDEFIDGEHIEGERTDGEHTDDEFIDGERIEGERTDGEHTDDEFIDGEHTGRRHTNSHHAESQRAERHHDERHHDERHHDERHHAESQHDESQHAERHHDESQNDERHHDERHHDERHHDERHHAESQNDERHHAESQNDERHHDERHHDERHHAESQNDDRHHADSQNDDRHHDDRHHDDRRHDDRHHDDSGHDETLNARSWFASIVREAVAAFASAPSVDELAEWLHPRSRVEDLPQLRILRFPTPAPEMRESPWPVPSLATTRELAMWLGIGLDALESFARFRADAPVRSPPDTHEDRDTRGRKGLHRVAHEGAVDDDRHAVEDDALQDRSSRYVRDPRARHYRYCWIRKPSGGYRLLEAPKPRLRAVQRDLLDGIIALIPPHEAAYAFRSGRSVVEFAAQHVGRETVIRLDLTAFFTSVFAPRVAGILRTAGFPDGVARAITAICTHRTPADVIASAPRKRSDHLGAGNQMQDSVAHTMNARRHVAAGDQSAVLDAMTRARLCTPHLPQGAPTSGALANLAAYRLDVRIAALAARAGATYGRYADDLVLSGDRTLAKHAPSIIARIGAIAIEEGFALNFRKTRVMTGADQQRVAGIVVNAKPAVQREEVERLRAILTNCVRTGPDVQNRDRVPDFRAHLRGRIVWVAQLDPVKGARLRAIFETIRWDVPSS